MRLSKILIPALILMATARAAWAAAPDLLPALTMSVDSGAVIQAQGLGFIDAPQSGSQNFSPATTDLHLAGGFILPVQDLVPFFGAKAPLIDCQDYAKVYKAANETLVQLGSQIAGYLGAIVTPLTPNDIDKLYSLALEICKQLPAKEQDDLLSQPTLTRQVIADIRNVAAGSTDVLFSAQSVDPYTAGFPLVPNGVAGVVIGMGSDVGSDGILLGLENSLIAGPSFSKPFNTLLMANSLALYRMIPNAAGKKVLQLSGYSSGWLDRPLQDATGKITNPNCFMAGADPKFPVVPKSYTDLLKGGCVGEKDVVSIVTPHLTTNSNADLESQGKSFDLVVVSRAAMGDTTKLPTKIGYLTIYRRTDGVPTDKSVFQDIWQFERSVTNAASGIPEPYGAAILRSWNAPAGKTQDSVIVTSNVAQSNRYYIYHYAPNGNLAAEPQPVLVGCVAKAGDCAEHGAFAPYRVAAADFNGDRCDDIALTRARVSVDPNGGALSILFAPYVDIYLQTRQGDSCAGQFMSTGKLVLPVVLPNTDPQVSSIAVADVNKDGRPDLLATDFNYYLNPATKKRENYVYFLENMGGGLLNTMMGLPRFAANTRDHEGSLGPVDVQVDRHGNVAVAIGLPVVKAPVVLHPPNVPITIENACATGKVAEGILICQCNRDMDGDGFGEFNLQKGAVTEMNITDCNGAAVKIPLDNTQVTLPDCVTGVMVTKTGRAWLREWARDVDGKVCDNCADFEGNDVCTGPEAGGIQICFNPSQKDNDGDGYGDICDAKPNDKSQSALPQKPLPLAQKKAKVLREDRVVSLDDGAVIAHYQDLKTVAGTIADPGHEITILLNKTNIRPTPPPCSNADLNCICKLNPDLQACKCLADPKAPGCETGGAPQLSCCLDVCRGDLTAPFPRMCDFIRPFNDEIRKITGLCMDVLVPVEGTQYHLSCTMPNAPALDLGNGRAYTQVFKTGQLPKNYFKSRLKPVASENVLQQPVLLNPADALTTPEGGALDISKLPKAQFNYSPLHSVIPDATLNQTPGIAQIDGVMQIESYLADVSAIGGPIAAKQAAAGAAGAGTTRALLLDIKGYSSPPGCQWRRSDCPDPMPNPPSAQDFVNAIQAKVREYQAAGKPISVDTLNDAFKSMDVGPAFLHQEFVIAGDQGTMVIPWQNTMGGLSAEGGCGCAIAARPTTSNTILPILFAALGIGIMRKLRRTLAKKH